MSKLIIILAVRQGAEPVVETIDSSLQTMQEFVGGYIQMVPISYEPKNGRALDLCCNEEAMFEKLPFNSFGILGPFFFTATDKNGAPSTLTAGEIEICKARWQAEKLAKHPSMA